MEAIKENLLEKVISKLRRKYKFANLVSVCVGVGRWMPEGQAGEVSAAGRGNGMSDGFRAGRGLTHLQI